MPVPVPVPGPLVWLLRPDVRRCCRPAERAGDGERGEEERDDEPQGVEETDGFGEHAYNWWPGEVGELADGGNDTDACGRVRPALGGSGHAEGEAH